MLRLQPCMVGGLDEGLDHIGRRIRLAKPKAAVLVEDLHDDVSGEPVQVVAIDFRNDKRNDLDPRDRANRTPGAMGATRFASSFMRLSPNPLAPEHGLYTFSK